MNQMKTYIPTLLVALVLFVLAIGAQAQDPSEGYILTPDKVRIFYKIVGTGTETVVMVHGGPGNWCRWKKDDD